MAAAVRPLIGVVGDFDPGNATHRFTNTALGIAGADFAWVATDDVGGDPAGRLAPYDGLWISPGSPYRSMEGALSAVRHARERGVPLVGT
jgi:CTP synthase (UTP-ammonia lyase)